MASFDVIEKSPCIGTKLTTPIRQILMFCMITIKPKLFVLGDVIL